MWGTAAAVLAAGVLAGAASRAAVRERHEPRPPSPRNGLAGSATAPGLPERDAPTDERGHATRPGGPGLVALEDVLAARPAERDALALAFLARAEAPAIREFLEAASATRAEGLSRSILLVALRLLMEDDAAGTLAWAREQTRQPGYGSGGLFDLALGIEAERDADAAVALAVGHQRLAGLIQIFETLARTSPEAAFALLSDWPLAGPIPAPRLADAIHRLARLDPGRLRAVAESAEGWTRRTLAEALAAVELERSPAGFEAWLVSLDPADRGPLAKAVANALAESDPAAGARMMAHFPASLDRAEAVAELAGRWALEDPAGATGWIRESLRGPERSSALAAAADAVRPTDLEAAVAIVEELASSGTVGYDSSVKVSATGSGRASGMAPDPPKAAAAVLTDLAATDPARALEIAGRFTDPPVDRILAAWVRADRDSAWEHVVSLPEGTFRRESARALGEALGAADPAEGGRRIAAIAGDDPAFAAEAASTLARAWSETAPEGALAWAVTLPEDAAPRPIGHALEAIARRDPDAAVNAVSAIPPDRLDASSIERLFFALDSAGPERLLEVLDRIPEPARPANAYGSIARQWVDRDPAAAFDWTDRLPPGEARDAASSSLAWVLSSSAPGKAADRDLPAAWAWARQIGDAGRRDQLLGWIAREWIRESPDAAAAAIRDDPGLDRETKQRLLSSER